MAEPKHGLVVGDVADGLEAPVPESSEDLVEVVHEKG